MSIEHFFLDEKKLKSVMSGYIQRNSQIEMAEIIDNAFLSFENQCIEAPTGSGKTMAYLIPSFSGSNRIIISTKTKQLMNQLLFKDIPIVQRITGGNKTVRSLKGRKNYFCPYRYYKYVHSKAAYYIDAVTWFEEQNKYGMIMEAPWGRLDNEVCSLMTADSHQCSGSKCAFFEECGFYVQKREANMADIIITNHFLLLLDIAMKSKESYGSIFEFRDNIVFDEAHSVPDIFSNYAGVDVPVSSLMLFFYENKDAVTEKHIDTIYKIYIRLIDKIKEPKISFEPFKNDFDKFIETATNIVMEINDDDLKDEYSRYLNLYKEYNSEKEGIRFIEKTMQKSNVILILKFIPFDSSSDFTKGLKETALSSIFVSATLTTGGNFEYFLKETGLENNAETHMLESVFDFKSQGRLFVPAINKGGKDNIYLQLLSEMPGSALIICNSLERMEYVEQLLKRSKIRKKIYTQVEINIAELDFYSEDMVLIGSATLREGIDISGGSFKAVILDQLPFEYPNDIVLKSKADRFAGEGNSFIDFFLPRAVLYFKQAVGRLIRHEKDFGLWVVLDDRIINKNYGKYFLDVVNNVKIIKNIEEALYFIKEEIHG